MTLGTKVPEMIGEDFADADGSAAPRPVPRRPPVLKAPKDKLAQVREKALRRDVGVIGMPVHAHQTNDYETFKRMLRDTAATEYLGLALYGEEKADQAPDRELRPASLDTGRTGISHNRRRPRRTPRSPAPRRRSRRSAAPRVVSRALCRASSALISAFSSSRPAQANSSDRTASAIGITTNAGPGRTSIATPAASSTNPPIIIPTRTTRGRKRCCSRCARSRSTSDGSLTLRR